MTTQTNPASPFQNNKDAQASTGEDFSIHTMNDDLASLQKNGILISEKKAEPIAKEIPKQKLEAVPAKLPTQENGAEDFISKPANPFAEQASTPSIKNLPPEKPVSSDNVPLLNPFEQKESFLTEVSSPIKVSDQSTATTYKIVMAFIVILIISIISLGLYYFLMTRAPQEALLPEPIATQEEPIEIEKPALEPDPVVIAPAEKYSQSKPNYLVLDLATMETSKIKDAILLVATELKGFAKQIPYEFIIVDANNNPVTFQIFATATKINFSPALLSTLDKSFSFFIYNDGDNSRIGLSIKILKESTLTDELKKQEKTFVTDASFLFLDVIAEIETGAFATTTFNNTVINYFNVNKQKDLSMDYAIVNSQLVISTSKNIQEALVNKLSQQPINNSTLKSTMPASTTSTDVIEIEPVISEE